MVSKALIAIFVGFSFVVGVAVLGTQQMLPFNITDPQQYGKVSDKVSDNLSALSQKIEEVSTDVSKLKVTTSDGSEPDLDAINSEIASLEREINTINAKLRNLNDLKNEVANLEEDLRSTISDLKNLKGDTSSQEQDATISPEQSDTSSPEQGLKTMGSVSSPLSVELGMSVYHVGESMLITGTGLPNKPVKIAILDGDGVARIEGSAMSDSSGSFTFSTELSNFTAGTYTAKVTQEEEVVEKPFRIIVTVDTTATQDLTLSIDRDKYARGESVLISGVTDQSTYIDLDIIDSNDAMIQRVSTVSDNSGSFNADYTIDSSAPLGTYIIKATSGDKEASISFEVSTTSSPSSLSVGSLTATTDKTTYSRGELVVVSGTASADSSVKISVDPSAGDELVLTTSADESGTWKTLFPIKTDASQGTWTVTVKQDRISTTVKITVV